MGSATASLALLLSVPVAILLFLTRKRAVAASLVAVGSVLLLPELHSFRLPLLPALDKESLPYLAMAGGLLLRTPGAVLQFGVLARLMGMLGLVVFLGVGTAMTNGDPVIVGTQVVNFIPGLNVKDGLFLALTDFVTFGVPFCVGAYCFRNGEDLRVLLRVFVAALLLYSVLILLESRISPQLHRMVYGYSPVLDFSMARRWGGYRPNVFTSHGLALSMIVCTAVILAAALRTERTQIFKLRVSWWMGYLIFVLVMCRSTGAILLGGLGLLVMYVVRPRMRAKAAMVLALIALCYPVLRASELVPVERLLNWAASISQDRAASLAFRFHNEELALDHVRERIMFGWGSYGRNIVWDPVIGTSSTVVFDGYWIIQLSRQGALSFLFSFGLLVTPVVRVARRFRYLERRDQSVAVGLALALALLTVDLIPNGLFLNYPFFLAGALFGSMRDAKARRSRRL